MGNNPLINEACCRCSNKKDSYKDSSDFQYQSYSDTFLLKIEANYNLLTKINFNDYINQLLEFEQSSTTLTGSMDSLSRMFEIEQFNEPIPLDNFTSFLDSRIINRDELYNYRLDNNDETLKIFKELMTEIYTYLKKHFKPYSEDKYNIIRKYHLLALGFLYCPGTGREKMEMLFKFFKNSKGFLQKTTKFVKFLIGLFLIPSICLINVRMKFNGKFPLADKVEQGDMSQVINYFEKIDVERLVGSFIKQFFYEKQQIDKYEFENIFVEKEYWWMFKPSGIRHYIEKMKANMQKKQIRLDAIVEMRTEDEYSEK